MNALKGPGRNRYPFKMKAFNKNIESLLHSLQRETFETGLKISQNSQENTCASFFLRIKLQALDLQLY